MKITVIDEQTKKETEKNAKIVRNCNRNVCSWCLYFGVANFIGLRLLNMVRIGNIETPLMWN